MPEYKIVLSKTAQKQLDKLPDQVVEILAAVILSLADDPRPVGCKKMKGRDGWRIRQGNYRIIYDILEDILVVDIIAVGHRKDVYN
jgi:mRNA interferase RelE/StbE